MTVIYGLLLAGGQGKRLHNQDKGLILFGDKPLVQHVSAVLNPLVREIIVSANRHIDEYRKLGFRVLEDDLGDFEGPLAGLHRTMKELGNTIDHPALILVAPCDAPFIPKDLLNRLLKAYHASNTLAVIPHDGSYLQPLFGLYSTELQPSLATFLDKGDRKVTLWVESLNPCIVDFSDEAGSFLNINSNEDLEAARKALGY